MLSHLIFQENISTELEAVVTPSGTTTWGVLRGQAESICRNHRSLAGRRVGLSFQGTARSYAALAALDKLKCDVFLLDGRLPNKEVLHLSDTMMLGALLSPTSNGDPSEFEVQELSGEEKWSGGSTVTILTSGSTGKPKAARHSWESLGRPIRTGSLSSAPRWILTYQPNLYAGLQVMLQCFADHGTLAIPSVDMNPLALVQFMSAAGVEYISATPSYWRRLLMFSDADLLQRIPLKQITLGGETIDQPVLDKLRHFFPKARLVHIYATTELGRCFSVSDGLAGFPVNYLDRQLPDGVELRVRERELLIRSPNRMRMYDPCSSQPANASEWFATSDLVEPKGDRVFFVGRKSDMINVAGSKVYPIEVEREIRAIPGVFDVRVYGKASSIAGELVACEIVPDPGQDAQMLKEAVVRACRSRLTRYQQPRLIKLVDRIAISSAGKTLRNKPS